MVRNVVVGRKALQERLREQRFPEGYVSHGGGFEQRGAARLLATSHTHRLRCVGLAGARLPTLSDAVRRNVRDDGERERKNCVGTAAKHERSDERLETRHACKEQPAHCGKWVGRWVSEWAGGRVGGCISAWHVGVLQQQGTVRSSVGWTHASTS